MILAAIVLGVLTVFAGGYMFAGIREDARRQRELFG